METKYCENCKETKSVEKFERNPDGSIRKHVCKACYGRKYRAQLKLEMLEVFGWKCQCCGEDNPHFLTLDHLDGGGSAHRAQYTSNNNEQIYSDARREGWPKDKYQLLCINCNWAKGQFGECPHKSNKTTADFIQEMKDKIFHTGKTLQEYSNNVGLKLGPLSQKIDPDVLRQHRLANSKKQKQTQQLRETLKNLGISQDKFAEILASSQVSQQNIVVIVAGGRDPAPAPRLL
jgi:hypothetical protein